MYERTHSPRRFTHRLYKDVGTVTGVLNDRMRAMMDGLDMPLNEVRDVFFQMVQLGESNEYRRALAHRRTLLPSADAMIERLGRARIVVLDTVRVKRRSNLRMNH